MEAEYIKYFDARQKQNFNQVTEEQAINNYFDTNKLSSYEMDMKFQIQNILYPGISSTKLTAEQEGRINAIMYTISGDPTRVHVADEDTTAVLNVLIGTGWGDQKENRNPNVCL